MKVVSLSGPSGTGKSTSAVHFAHEQHVEAMIDDGLLIVKGKKIAGTSAKFEKNTVTAVRRAIFDEAAHRDEVKKAITEYQIESLLIIGTSDKMTKKIAKALDLPEIESFFYITDIRTENEIRRARFVRETEGKHVMPVSADQVNQNFFKQLIKKGWDIFSPKREKIGETTIVHPDFHQQTVSIHKRVYLQLVRHIMLSQLYVHKVEQLSISTTPQVIITVSIVVKTPITPMLREALESCQQQMHDDFLQMFGFSTDKIYVKVVKVA